MSRAAADSAQGRKIDANDPKRSFAFETTERLAESLSQLSRGAIYYLVRLKRPD